MCKSRDAARSAMVAISGTCHRIRPIAGSNSDKAFTEDGITHNNNTNWITAGTVFILGGLVAAIYGGAAVVDNAHTCVNGGVATPPEKKAPGTGASVQLSAKREPTYREAGLVPVSGFTGISVPLLNGRF